MPGRSAHARRPAPGAGTGPRARPGRRRSRPPVQPLAQVGVPVVAQAAVQVLAQAAQPGRPEAVEPRQPAIDLPQPVAGQRVVALTAGPALAHHADVKHQPKVLGYGGPAAPPPRPQPRPPPPAPPPAPHGAPPARRPQPPRPVLARPGAPPSTGAP